MSLFKQISLIMSLFLIFVFISVIYLSFQSAKQYAQEEMSNNAQNTATYLSLSLSNAKGNVPKMTAMINAIYDSGYFKRIRLIGTNEELLYTREKEKEKANVPQWFMSLYDFQVPTAKATVSSGWNPIGTIEVTPMEDNAHAKLYQNSTEILQSFALISFISFGLLYLLLRLILASLTQLTKQAEAVSDNTFIITQNIPATREFKEVTLAMNKMVEKVKSIFEREAAAIQDYHKLLYIDSLTGLSNKNFLELKLNDFLSSQESDASGSILTLYIEGIIEANKTIGPQKVDALIQELASTIQEASQKLSHTVAARSDGTKICIIFPNREYAQIEELSESVLTQALVSLEKSGINHNETSIKVLISSYSSKDSINTLFSRIQNALSNAQKNSITELTQESLEQDHITKELIENKIQENAIALAVQDVYDNEGHILHSEAYVRLIDEDKNIHEAGSFIPLIHKMHLDTKLDQNVINYALKEPLLDEMKLAINLSLRFLQSNESVQWLKERLASVSKEKVLNFEMSNHNLLSSLNEAYAFSSMLRESGHIFGIDRFSVEEGANLNYLQMIKPEYLKIDATYLQDMLTGEQGQKNNALQILIESLDIKIIATNIEDKEIKQKLESLGIKYFQGSHLAKPKLV